MSIRYTCGCGANIKLPHTAAGRKAKCKSCGNVFKVPRQPSPDAPTVLSRPKPPVDAAPPGEGAESAPEAGSWLDDMAISEAQAAGEPVVLDLAEPASQAPQRTGPTARADNETPRYAPFQEDRDWIIGPQQSFWADLGASFLFFLEPSNLISFLALSLASVMVNIPLVSCFAFVLAMMVGAYVQVFLLATVRETASGEDDLPGVWISSFWDDLAVPALQLAGTWLYVMAPAIALACWAWADSGDVDWSVFDPLTAWQGHGLPRAVAIARLVGQFFWPAVVLAIAIGGSFWGLWPHIVVRTALCSPLGYLAICAAVVVATLVAAVPRMPQVVAAVGGSPWGSLWGLSVASEVLWLYAAIVEMRVIGLYYRHYKHRLPWVAE